MVFDFALAGFLAATSLMSALAGLGVISRGLGRVSHSSDGVGGIDGHLERAVFLFEGQELLDATSPALALLRDAPAAGSDRDRLLAALGPHFLSLDEQLAEVEDLGEIEIRGTAPEPLSILATHVNGVTRVEVFDPKAEGRGVLIDGLSNRANETELSLLRTALTHSPVLVWRVGADGRVDWANRAYLRRAAEHLGVEETHLTWPLPSLFPTGAPNGEVRRQRVLSPDPTRAQWYECRSSETGDGPLHYAIPIDPTVRAESALREFVQTLTKTFAQLPIGLAVFDRQRQLAIFNPALIDLTRLSPEFLSGRPTLFDFLDSLREGRIIPEPKDYPSWRQTMTELETAAASGLYEETWTLTTGQTYRVIGRPHPDGAVAFLFEDITADVSLTRRFRSEIEMGQAVIDKIDDAIAVFSQAGTIVLSNAGYAALWGIDPQSTLGTVSIADAIAMWRRHSRDPDIWDVAHEFVTDITYRDDMVAETELTRGFRLACRLSRLNGGGTMVRFRRVTSQKDAERRRLTFATTDDKV